MNFLIVGVIEKGADFNHVHCISALVDLSTVEHPATVQIAESLAVANQDYVFVTEFTNDLEFSEKSDRETFCMFLAGARKNQFYIQ